MDKPGAEIVRLYRAPRQRKRKTAQRYPGRAALAVFMWAASFTVLLLGAEKLAELLARI